MANYLQRIADSGARISSLAKPPATARGLIPPVGPLQHPAIGEEAAQSMENPPDHWIPGRTAADAFPESGAQALPPHEAMTADEPATSKNAPLPVAIPQRIAPQNSASQISVRAPKALRASASRVVHEHSVHKVAEETIRTFAPRALASRTVPVPPQAAEKKSVAATDQAQPFSQQERVRGEEPPPTVQPSKKTGEVGTEIEETLRRIPPGSYPPGDEPRNRNAAEHLPTYGETHSTLAANQKALTEKPISETRWLQVSSTSPAQSTRQPAPTELRRRSQISIGRIDVQVDNQARPQATSPPQARVPARINSLERRYLGRFLLTL
jgi:hypothetical protein